MRLLTCEVIYYDRGSLNQRDLSFNSQRNAMLLIVTLYEFHFSLMLLYECSFTECIFIEPVSDIWIEEFLDWNCFGQHHNRTRTPNLKYVRLLIHLLFICKITPIWVKKIQQHITIDHDYRTNVRLHSWPTGIFIFANLEIAL